MTAELVRSPGQTPMLPGAVRAGTLVYSSGVVSPTAMIAASEGRDPGIAFSTEADEAVATLLTVLDGVGAGPDRVVKLEAFLSDSADFAAWNESYGRVWPQPGPARTTLVSGFALPGIRIEIQAVAVLP